MSYCPNCGSLLNDAAKFCENCGTQIQASTSNDAPAAAAAPVATATVDFSTPAAPAAPAVPTQDNVVAQTTFTGQSQHSYSQPYTQAIDMPLYEMSDSDRTLRLVAFILNVILTVCMAMFIIPLAWMIPMTVHSWGIYKGKKPNTVAFGVCTLLFLSLISGILLLVSKKDQ